MAGNPPEHEEAAALRRRVAELEAELAAVRKAAEAAGEPLAAREVLLARAEKGIHLGSWFYNVAAGEVKWSEELYHILGYDSSRDQPSVEKYFDVVHPEDREKVARDHQSLIERDVLIHQEYRIKRPDGTVRDVLVDPVVVRDADGNIVRMVGTVLDVTERKQLELQLRQSHKMEAVGRLAAGVAHDFNNLLSVIGGNIDLLLEGRPDDRLRRIREAAEVGAALTRQLLAFSQQSVVRPGLQDVGEVIRDTSRIIERLIGEHISIRMDLSGERCAVLADRAQLQQILLNLCINSRDAMPGGGLIRIAMEPIAGDTGVTGAAAEVPAGQGGASGWVRIIVEDTGTGMDEPTRARAFEPFFTTKDPGKGTGLGLHAVQEAVTRANGRIAIDSDPGRGTRAIVLLPRRNAEPAASPRPSEPPRGGGESILVVEDHPALRELIRCFLADAGYGVHVVGRPGEAEVLWEREQGGIDLLVTDLVMPEKSGRALAAELVGRKPSLKTLFISGYAQGSGSEKRVDGPYLQKPFTRVELLHTVRAILDGVWDGDGTRRAASAPQAAVDTAGSVRPARPRDP